MSDPKIQKQPFRKTHERKKDKLPTMLMAITNGVALYRVKFSENGRNYDNVISASEKHFMETFA